MKAFRKNADVRPPSPRRYGGQAGEDGRVILAHLLCCAGFAVCLYNGTPRAAHLRQTDAMQNQGNKNTKSLPAITCGIQDKKTRHR